MMALSSRKMQLNSSMLPFLAKWIDRSTIRLAAKHMRLNGARPFRPQQLAEVHATFLFETIATTPEISFSTSSAFRFSSAITPRWEENNHVHGFLFPCGDNWSAKPPVTLLHGWNADYSYRFQFPRL